MNLCHALDFSGKTAIVTGAAHGFGRAIGIAFAERGAHVWACDVLDDELRETEALCRQRRRHRAARRSPTCATGRPSTRASPRRRRPRVAWTSW